MEYETIDRAEEWKYTPPSTTCGTFIAAARCLGFGSGKEVGYKYGYFPSLQAGLLLGLTLYIQTYIINYGFANLLVDAVETPEEKFCEQPVASTHESSEEERSLEQLSITSSDVRFEILMVASIFVFKVSVEIRESLYMLGYVMSVCDWREVCLFIYVAILPKLYVDCNLTAMGLLFLLRCKDFFELTIDTVGLLFILDIPKFFLEMSPQSLRYGVDMATPKLAAKLPTLFQVLDRCGFLIFVISGFPFAIQAQNICGHTLEEWFGSSDQEAEMSSKGDLFDHILTIYQGLAMAALLILTVMALVNSNQAIEVASRA